MSYFPIYMNIKNEDKVLLIGGGKVALQKLKVLIDNQINIHLVAEQVDLSIYEYLSGYENSETAVEMELAEYREELLSDAYSFVIAATNDRELNSRIAVASKERNIPVNVVDDPELSTFIFPSIIKRGDLVIGISSSGKAPAVTQYYKERFAQQLPDNIEEILEAVGEYREQIKNDVRDHKKRAAMIRERFLEML